MTCDMEIIINPELMPSQLPVAGLSETRTYTQLMVENEDTFGSRFEALRGARSYQDLSDAIDKRYGLRISPQAMHKWVKGGGITPDNAKIVAEFFGVTPGWLLFGEGADTRPSVEDAMQELPGDQQQQTIDFLEYQLHRSAPMIAREKLAKYMAMIDGIRRDLEKKRRGQ